MEIINNNQITPHRLHALIRLVPRLTRPTRQSLLDLLQPPDLFDNQAAGKAVFNAGLNFGLLYETSEGVVCLHEDIKHPGQIEAVEGFRRFMQDRLSGAIEEHEDNYLLSLVTAWYAVQDEQIFRFERKNDIFQYFNEQVDQRGDATRLEEGRVFNREKLNGWLSWADFLGWGWRMTVDNVDMLIPDAHVRLIPLLDTLLHRDTSIPFRDFANQLAVQCPELDGGQLFEKVWERSRGSEQKGNRVSLMLSTALRVLHERQQLRLLVVGDAPDQWTLFPAEGHSLQIVTHIQGAN